VDKKVKAVFNITEEDRGLLYRNHLKWGINDIELTEEDYKL
jgi:hypothetical protein